MTGWQRFFLLFVACVGVMIFWPQYDMKGVTFILMAFILWTCVIMLLSVLINLFAIYKSESLHRLVSLAFLVVMIGSLLYYFPLEDKQTPFSRLLKHQWPTGQDIKEGVKRLTFNFDFARRNVHREANFVNQKIDKASDDTDELKQAIKKQKEKLDIIVETLGDKK